MKKLMIAVAATALAFAANAAASVNWAGYAYSGDPTVDANWFTGGQAYLVLLTDSAAYTTMDDLLAAGTIVDSVGVDYGAIGTATINDSDTIFGGSGTKYLAILATTDGTGLGGEPAAYGIPTTGNYGIYQGEMAYTAGAGGTFSIPSSYNDGWGAIDASTPVAVPEPTSGLLLLLGVAGLALRRRRA